jgi:SNF2 family DNA or RNA helicase
MRSNRILPPALGTSEHYQPINTLMQLFPYQKIAVDFMRDKKKAYLALDMGMGKTLTSLAAAHGAGKHHILLIAEKNEIVNSENFRREVETYFPDLTYHSLREVSLEQLEYDRTLEGRAVCGINPEGLVKHDIRAIAKMFDTMVIDEATMAKTTTTERFKGIQKVAKAMKHVFLLSGTPMMNGAAELYAPLLLLEHPMVHGKKAGAKKAFEIVFAGGNKKQIKKLPEGVDAKIARYKAPYCFTHFTWWSGGANNVRELRYILRDHFFFMLKGDTDVFKNKLRTMEKVAMTLPWLAEYTKAWDDYFEQQGNRSKKDLDNIKELRNLIENGKMYQVNSRWKAKRVAKDIADGKYGDRRIVVFSIFIETDQFIQEELAHLGVSFKTFEEIKEYKEGDAQVLVGRIRAHGKGGNVPQASVALFVDMDFVPANNIQAENRIDRPEQKNDMLIVYYMTEGEDVIDTHVRNINRDKSSKIQQFMRPLTEEELRGMPQRIAALRNKYPKETKILGI